MSFRGFKLHIILIVFVACLVTAVGVQRLAYSQRVAGPLERAFAEMDGVAAVVLAPRGNSTDVELHVEPGADVPRLYREAEALAQARLGARLGRVRLADRRTADLVDAFHRMHLVLQEGAATGRFSQMAQQVAELAAELALDDYRVFVDDSYVYIMLADGDGYLYEMIARPIPGERGREPGV